MHEEYGTEYAIEMVDAWKVYKTPGGTVEALRGINLALELGMIHVLLGPNGSGKTTSLETAVGLRSLTRGTVRTLGVNPKIFAGRGDTSFVGIVLPGFPCFYQEYFGVFRTRPFG